MRFALVALLLCGCAHKPPKMDYTIRYRIFVYPSTCRLLPDGSYICKARFDPQEVKAK